MVDKAILQQEKRRNSLQSLNKFQSSTQANTIQSNTSAGNGAGYVERTSEFSGFGFGESGQGFAISNK